jgi:ABC-2 type transport system ATP-binding protein
MTELVVHDLSKSFGAVQAVRNMSFTVPPGVTGFLGPNGAGKTTTLRMLLGLVRPGSGSATIGGRRYADLPHPRRVVGAMLDSAGFHPGRTGAAHLRIAGASPRRVDELLGLVGLTTAQAGRRVRGYSLGMKQRLGLAAALVGDPSVLVLDEPGNGLDPAGMAWLRGMLRNFATGGGTVLISSHVLAEVEQTVDRVVIVNDGALRFDGALDELPGGLEAAFLQLTGSVTP